MRESFNSLYERVKVVLRKLPGERPHQGCVKIEPWFKKRSYLFKDVTTETLLDVIQHCEFVTVQEDDLIIHQGEKGHRFYIILRGNISVIHKDSLEDVDLGDEGEIRSVDRSTLGNELVKLGEGATFGEIALISPDCIRTASIVANEKTDLVVIHRDLYNRSVSKVIAKEYAEKMTFIDSVPLFSDWSTRWKKHLAASLKKETYLFDCPICHQGDKAESMYFIVSGEVRLLAEPEAHQEQFSRFMSKCGDACDSTDSIQHHDSAYFPQKLLPQIEKFSRVNKSNIQQRSRSNAGNGIAGIEKDGEEMSDNGVKEHLPHTWSPSAIRKMNAQIKSKRVNINLCYLGEKQYFGAIELLLGLDMHHTTAVTSRETVVMSMYRSHFERLFRRRNPNTLRRMAETAELQLTRRVTRPNLLEFLPLLKCFVYKLQEVKRDTGKSKLQVQALHADQELVFDLPKVRFEGKNSKSEQKLNRSYSWSIKPDVQPPHRPRKLHYSLHPGSANERKLSMRSENKTRGSGEGNAIKRLKHSNYASSQPLVTMTTASIDSQRSTSPVPTHVSVDSWYSNKSFLPGLRRGKTLSAVSQSSGYYSDASAAIATYNRGMNQNKNNNTSFTPRSHINVQPKIRCGSLLLKPISRTSPTYSFF